MYKKRHIYSLLTTLLVIFTLISEDLSIFGSYLRYLKYSPLLIGLVLIFKGGVMNYKLFKNDWNLIFPFLLIILSTFIHIKNYSIDGFQYIIFIIAAILPFFSKYKIKVNYKLINITCFITFFIIKGANLSLDLSINAFLNSSTSSGETNMLPFIFGLFTIFWLISKNKFYFVLNLIFIILSFKRIVFSGVILSILILFLPKKIKLMIKNPFLLVGFNFSYLLVILGLGSGLLDDIILEITGLSAGHFTQGRSTFVQLLHPHFIHNFSEITFFGIGTGNIRLLLANLLGYDQHLHNDVLLVFYEQGLIVFSIFFYFLYKHSCKSSIFYLVIFLNILFLSDNTLGYTPVLFLFLLLCQQINYNENTNNSQQIRKA